MKSSTTKTAPRKAKEAKTNGANGDGAGGPRPFVYLPPPRDEALSVADPLDERGELVCTGETTLDAGRMLELYRWLQLTRLVEERRDGRPYAERAQSEQDAQEERGAADEER